MRLSKSLCVSEIRRKQCIFGNITKYKNLPIVNLQSCYYSVFSITEYSAFWLSRSITNEKITWLANTFFPVIFLSEFNFKLVHPIKKWHGSSHLLRINFRYKDDLLANSFSSCIWSLCFALPQKKTPF